MAFLEVRANPNPASKADVPLLLEVQAGLLSGLETRVVVPLYRKDAVPGRSLTRLTPDLEFQGRCYVAMVPELAGVARRHLGESLGLLPSARSAVIAALDMLFTGI